MRSKTYLLHICFWILFSYVGNAQILENVIQDIEEQPVEIVDTLNRKYDTRELTVRKIDKELKEEYSGGEFNYERTTATSQNLFARFFSWMMDGLQRVFGFQLSPLTIKILTYLFYFIIGAAVIFMIVRLVGNESASKLFGKTAKKSSNVEISDTHIEEIDFTTLIENSEREGSYRNAIRFQYLALLKSLSTKGLIDWDFQKTNSDYYHELKNLETREYFKKVSYLYDHVWYGEFPIDEETYKEAVTEFQSLKNRAA